MGKRVTILPSWSLHSGGRERDSWDLDFIWEAWEGFLEEVATEPRMTRKRVFQAGGKALANVLRLGCVCVVLGRHVSHLVTY